MSSIQLIGIVAAAEDVGWPHRRGPQFNALSSETGLADSWPEEGPPLLWAKEIGQGYSGFTAAGGRCYTQTQSLYSQHVLCLEAATGETIWKHRCGGPYLPNGMYPGPRATPTLYDGKVYFAAPSGLVGCLDQRDGSLIWQVNVVEKFKGQGADFGFSCSPTVVAGKVVLPVGGKGASVVAMDAEDGSTVWTGGDEPASYCSAIPIRLEYEQHVVAFLRNSLAAFELHTGALLWQHDYTQGYDEHAAAPLYHEPYLVAAFPWYDGAKAYRLSLAKPLRTNEPPSVHTELVWDTGELSNDVASSVIFKGHIYGFDLRETQSKARRPSRGTFKCLELTTGEVRWASDRPGHASVIVADGKLILFNDRGELILAKAAPRQYEELARTQVFEDEICWTPSALDQGRLFLRSPTRAACLYLGDPASLTDQQRASGALASIPSAKTAEHLPYDELQRRQLLLPPRGKQLDEWFAACLAIVFAPAAVLAAAGWFLGRFRGPAASAWAARLTFLIAAVILGVAGASLARPHYPRFLLTWPAALFAGLMLTLLTIRWAEAQSNRRRARWLSRIVGCLFLLGCFAYFHFCRQFGLENAWVFLAGLLPALAVAWFAIRSSAPCWRETLYTVLAFSTYFLVCRFLVWIV